MMKKCGRCKEMLEASSFQKYSRAKHGLQSYCRKCTSLTSRENYTKSGGLYLQTGQLWRAANKDRYRVARLNYFRRNKEKCLAKAREWRERNKDYDAFRASYRRALLRMAVPKWADKEAIRDVYAEASCFGLQVDHIVPVQSKLVCGLHTWDNLQLISYSHNTAKGNRHWPDMPCP